MGEVFKDALRRELTAAVARRESRATTARRRLAAAVVTAAAGAILAFVIFATGGDGEAGGLGIEKTSGSSATGVERELLPVVAANSISLQQLEGLWEETGHSVLVPNVSEANLGNLTPHDPSTGAEIESDGSRAPTGIGLVGPAVRLEFPTASDSVDDLRQPYIAVQERRLGDHERFGSGSPEEVAAAYEAEVTSSEVIGRSLCAVEELPALCIEARSPSDEFERNSAFLEFVRDGLVIRVTGGDDVGLLQNVAASLQPLERSGG